jgi:hypothetical protein
VVKRTAHNSEISLVERKKPVLNMTIGRARTQIQDLEVTVPIHSDAVLAIFSQKYDVYGAGHIEGPDVNPLSIDLRLNDAELVFAGVHGNMHVAGPQMGTPSLPGRIVLFYMGVGCGRSLRLRHGVLPIRKYVSSWLGHPM